MSPLGRPWDLSNVTGRGIFRATGQSTRARDPAVVIKRILSSSNRGSLAGFKKRYNRMDATGLTGKRLVMSTNPCEALELSETSQGRLGSASHITKVFITWSITIEMTLLFIAGVYLSQNHLENISDI